MRAWRDFGAILARLARLARNWRAWRAIGAQLARNWRESEGTPMTARYSVQIGWHSSAMREVAQTGFYSANESSLQRLARQQTKPSKAKLIFDFSAPGVPPIQTLMQFWAGWREGGTWLDGPDPPFLGFITKIVGGGAAVHTIDVDVESPQFLNTRATVIGWPTGEDGFQPAAGYPPDYSVTNWLIGSTPYTGCVPAYVPGALYDGVDATFASLIFDATALPGGNWDSLNGQFGFTHLDKILQDIVGQVRVVAARDGRLVEPVYFWETAAVGSLLRPRFRFIDGNDTTGPVKAVFSTDPQPGELGFWNFSHTRDAKDVRTDVVVSGIGGDPATGRIDHTRYNDHNSDYPCEYLPHGWGGEPYTDSRIASQAKTSEVAAAIGYRVWGALGQLDWETDGVAEGGTLITYLRQGDVIALYDPTEGQNYTRYVVRDVEPLTGQAGHPTYKITVGDLVPSVKELIAGATVVQPHRRIVAVGGIGSLSGAQLSTYGLPGAPAHIPMERAPVHSQQNVMKPAYTTVVGQTYRAGTQLPVGADPFAPPAPANQIEHYSSADVKTQWTDNDGIHHPVGVYLTWSVDGPRYFAPWADGIGFGVSALERAGSPGAVLSYTRDTGGGPVPVTPPFDAAKNVPIVITATGVDPSSPLMLTFREQDQYTTVIP